MSYYWIVFTVTWLGAARSQYINEVDEDPTISADNRYSLPVPYGGYFTLPVSKNEYVSPADVSDIDTHNRFSLKEFYATNDLMRQRRTIEGKEDAMKKWQPNAVENGKTQYFHGEDKSSGNPFVVQGYLGKIDENATELQITEPSADKKSFSPWGGKRDTPFIEQTWTWKRSANIKEPSMPKRVRFSPWGGKRSGQVIYKPGTKGSKLIFSSSVPELTKIVSNYAPNGQTWNLAGFQILPLMDKKHPIRILALSTKLDRRSMRDAMPFTDFIEVLPKFFKPGHPYVHVDIKKDGKRKVKFSAWGGKRSPPIIGPIWTPLFEQDNESPLHKIILAKDQSDKSDDHTVRTFI